MLSGLGRGGVVEIFLVYEDFRNMRIWRGGGKTCEECCPDDEIEAAIRSGTLQSITRSGWITTTKFTWRSGRYQNLLAIAVSRGIKTLYGIRGAE